MHGRGRILSQYGVYYTSNRGRLPDQSFSSVDIAPSYYLYLPQYPLIQLLLYVIQLPPNDTYLMC